MKLVFPILALIISAGFIFYLAGRLDKYRNRYKRNMDLLRISCDSPSHLHTIQHTIDYCASVEPPIDCDISKGHGKAAIQKLMHGLIDLVLISESEAVALNQSFPFLKVSRLENANSCYIDFIDMKNVDNDEHLYLLWNHSVFSESRDRFLFFVKNDFRLLNCGYREY